MNSPMNILSIQQLFALGMKREIKPLLPLSSDGMLLELGPGKMGTPYTTHELDQPGWNADTDPIPYPDESFGGIVAFHFLEHCKNPIAVLQECARVLKPGGTLTLGVPYYRCNMAHHDLGHFHFFTEATFDTLLDTRYYLYNKLGHLFRQHQAFVMFLVERNQMLFVQLVRL